MFDDPTAASLIVLLLTTPIVYLLLLLVDDAPPGRLQQVLGLRKPRSAASRLGDVARSALPRLGAPLQSEMGRVDLQDRLLRAGLYDKTAVRMVLGAKVLLLGIATITGLALGLAGFLGQRTAVLVGGALVAAAALAPDLWLARRARLRQAAIRRGVPDVLDLLTICLEAGLALPDALHRVVAEMETAHPLLAGELAIVQREMLLGLSAGEALSKFGRRSGVAEVRDLATVLTQAERFGTSTAAALRLQSELMRQVRYQRAEEQAQKAAVKILFPTLIFIFPAIFVVVLTPAIQGLVQVFKVMRGGQ